MMTEQQSEKSSFEEAFGQLYASTVNNPALGALKKKSWDCFQRLGLPERKSDHFRYANVHRLYNLSFHAAEKLQFDFSSIAAHVYPECTDSVIVFVNGYFDSTLSRLSALPEKLVILSLDEAMRTYGALLTNHWTRSAKEEQDPFAALNGACHNGGAFLYLPPKVVCSTPLQVLHILDSRKGPSAIMPRLQVFAGQHSVLEMISSHVCLQGNNDFINQVSEFTLEDNADIRYYQADASTSADLWHFEAVRTHLKRDSRFKSVWTTKGGAAARNDYKVVLAGENSHASLNGVWKLNGRREAHCHVYVDHRAPYTTSMQLFKGVLYDSTHSSFEGQIVVQQEAQKTNAFQLNNNLVLSEGAHADSSPNLRIFADDVKASHGATVGQIPEEELFYMRTRGLPFAEAQGILVAGFCNEVVSMMPVKEIPKP